MHYPAYEQNIYDIYKPLIEDGQRWVTIVEPFTVRAKLVSVVPLIMWTSSLGYYRRWLVNLQYRRKGIKYESVGIPYHIPGEDELRKYCIAGANGKIDKSPEHFNNVGFGFVEFVFFDIQLVKQEVVEPKFVFNPIPFNH
jgi:hypothetical protein